MIHSVNTFITKIKWKKDDSRANVKYIMGIKDGMNFYYSLKNLDLKDILLIGCNISNDINPHISVDCNWVVFFVRCLREDHVRKLVVS